MSYILEALRRAETERQRGSVPNLHSQVAEGAALMPPPARGIGRWLTAALAALVLVLAGWIVAPTLHRLIAGGAGAGATGATGAGGSGLSAASAPSGASSQAASPADPAPPPATPGQARPEGHTASAEPGRAGGAAARGSGPADPPPAGAAGKAASAPAARPPSKQVVKGAPSATASRASAGAAATLVPAGAAATGAGAAAAAPVMQALRRAELPEPVRRALPPLALGGVVYSAVPASRLAVVDAQVLREGESAGQGVMVDRITPLGVIFRVGELRFEVLQ